MIQFFILCIEKAYCAEKCEPLRRVKRIKFCLCLFSKIQIARNTADHSRARARLGG
ncbi:hypothetical protein PEC301645_09830 [Pectobacterium carotovorum subsp. carotovorum]|nr:hypothetical protein PEC301645_09830 [Pectobacterium carotovorum subsp. carotovorum]